jgi:cell division protein FtsQ
MPPSSFYTAHVPIITGHVKKALVSTDLFNIANIIHHDKFLEAQIEQIYVTSNGEYALIPRAGRQTIELGNAENLDLKFKSLKALYLQIFNKNAWNKYKTISLKYDGQVVCTKK